MSSPAATAGAGNSTPKDAGVSAWLAVAAGSIGSLMATLDISIVNSALPTIQGEIGASGSEGTWISTAYLVAEIVMIPLTGWLERCLGLRTFLLICSAAFTFFSVFCGLCDTLPMMIFGRVGQGFTGGALIPTAMTIVATQLPPHQQMKGTAIFGMTIILGPVLGPLIGGWLTEHVSWHYAFFINLPICLGLIALLLLGLPHQKGHYGELLTGDWMGIIGLSAALGGLTTVLEEGQREQWFSSPLIIRLSIVSFIGFVLLLIGQFTHKKPVIHLKILLTRTFFATFILILVIGMLIFGNPYLIPQVLVGISGYNAEQSSYVLLLVGLPAMAFMFITPVLLDKYDVRLIVFVGMLFYVAASFSNMNMTVDVVGSDFAVRQLLQGVGLGITVMALNQCSISSVPPSLASDASGLFNAGRNLGGSIGLAIISTMQERRDLFHNEIIGSSVTANSPGAQQYLHDLAQVVSTWPGNMDPQQRALGIFADQVQRQAAVMTFQDLFWIFGVIVVVSIPLILLLRPLPKETHMGMVH